MKIVRPILSTARNRLSAIPATRSGNRTILCANRTTPCFAGQNKGKILDITGFKAVIP